MINFGDMITPGYICYSCAKFSNCPAGNNNKQSTLEFTGVDEQGNPTIYGCAQFEKIEIEYVQMNQLSSNGSNRIIKAELLNDAELDVLLYRMIRSSSAKTQNELFNYWKYIYNDAYAKEMVTDTNETKSKTDDIERIREQKKKHKHVFDDDFKVKGDKK